MRNRIRVLVGVARRRRRARWSSPRPRSRRRRPARRPKPANEGGRGVHPRSSTSGGTVDDCQKAPIAVDAREQRDHLGLARVPGAARRHVEVRRARGQEHGARSARTGSATTSRRPRRRGPRPRTRRRSYHAQLADARDEAGRIIEEARQAADQVRRDLIARAEAEAAEIRERAAGRHREPARSRRWPTCGPRSPTLSIDLAERIVERNLDRDTQPPARRELHRPGRGATDRWLTASRRRTPRRSSRSREPEDHARRGRGRALPVRADRRGQRRPAHGAHRPGSARRPARRDRRRAAREPRAARSRGRSRRSSSARAGATTSRRSSTRSSSSRRRPRARGRRGPLRGRRSTTRSSSGSPTALVAGDRQAHRGEGRSSTRRCSAARRHDRRHGHRRHGPSPPRPVEGDSI